jgi:hypothetical protein
MPKSSPSGSGRSTGRLARGTDQIRGNGSRRKKGLGSAARHPGHLALAYADIVGTGVRRFVVTVEKRAALAIDRDNGLAVHHLLHAAFVALIANRRLSRSCMPHGGCHLLIIVF